MIFNEENERDEEFSDEDAAADGSKESEEVQEREFYGFLKQQAASSERRTPLQLWLISYSDFMTILMVFFLAMYGYTHLAKVALQRAQTRPISYEALSEVMKKVQSRLGSSVQVEEDGTKLSLRLQEKVLFVSGRASLERDGVELMETLAESVNLVPGNIIVEGHTDDVPIRGGAFRSNWELSAARAFSVISALTSNGVDPKRLSAWGFGEYRPIQPNESAIQRAQNRRIEIVIMKSSPEKVGEKLWPKNAF